MSEGLDSAQIPPSQGSPKNSRTQSSEHPSRMVTLTGIVVQSLSHVQLFATPWTAADHAPLSSTISQSLFKCMSIELVMHSNHLILCHPLFLLPSIFPTSGSFQMSQLSTSGGQSIRISALASVFPMNIQDCFPFGSFGTEEGGAREEAGG